MKQRNNEPMIFELKGSGYEIKQEQTEDAKYQLTISKNGNAIFSSIQEKEISYSELNKTLKNYVRATTNDYFDSSEQNLYENLMAEVESLCGAECVDRGFKPLKGRELSLVREAAELVLEWKFGQAVFSLDDTTITIKRIAGVVKVTRAQTVGTP